MASKQVQLAGIGLVTLAKSARSKHIRLSVTQKGIRVSLPRWTPYAVGIAFVHKHEAWVKKQTAVQPAPHQFTNGQRIGKLHTLTIRPAGPGQKPGAAVRRTTITVRLGQGEKPDDRAVQERCHKAVIRALKYQAELLLPPRLKLRAARHDLSYASVSVRQLVRRWGSCDSSQNITFNLFLMQVPWPLIDYVICHELTHTKHMNHSPAFWDMLETLYPYAKQANRQLRNYLPAPSGAPETETVD